MGIVQHFEIPADDVERAVAFYATVFGWTSKRASDDLVFIDPTDGGPEQVAIGGDIHQRADPSHGPTFVVTVESIEDSLALIETAGGTRHGEIQVLEGEGRFTYFLDPEGNRVGLWDTLI